MNQPRGRFLPLLMILFFGSGCAALIYEIVWFQLLQLVIGSSAVSLGVLLATFMGGLSLGSLALPRIISFRRHPLRVYAMLELGIGLIGIAVLREMPSIAAIYTVRAESGATGIALRAVMSAVCLLPPTLLMGATLPAMSRWVTSDPDGVSWLGFFYGGNTVGAVCGCLLAGFYLLRVHDMAVATYVAAAINGMVGLTGLLASEFLPSTAADAAPPASPPPVPACSRSIIHLVIALSGMSALGAEVVWTRLLSLLLGPTVYTFSVILAVFLVGLGVGSSFGAMLARFSPRPRILLGMCQLGLAAAIAWSAWALARCLPYWPVDPSLTMRPGIVFQLDLMRCIFAIAPATLLWGMSFPLALAAAAESRNLDPARLVSGVYAANTAGAIVGALAFSMIAIPWIGTQQAQRVMIGIAALAALIALARRPATATAWLLIIAAVATPLAWSVRAVPWQLVAYGRYLMTTSEDARNLYVGEGTNSTVAVTEGFDGTRNFHVAGKIEASTEPQDMRLQRMLGHLPALLHPAPRSVLIVGCGAGVTAGSFVNYPGITRIVICEIEPLVPPLADQYFGPQNYHVVHDPRVRIVFDDARHFVLTTSEKFDIITSDPIHPWVKGSATLYTRQYFETCKRHLNPGGMVTQWVPLYQSTEATVQSELATFFSVFPDGTVWNNSMNNSGYDLVLLGREGGDQSIDIDGIQDRLNSPDGQLAAASLSEVGFSSAYELLATFAGRAPDLQAWLADAVINTDQNLRLQYLAGWGMDSRESDQTYKDLIAHVQYPSPIFVGSHNAKLQMDMAMLREKARR
jgi:spermidine synthase